jgi:hypothetical protein
MTGGSGARRSVVGVAATTLLIWLFRDHSNHPRRGLGRVKASQAFTPSLSKGSLFTVSTETNYFELPPLVVVAA